MVEIARIVWKFSVLEPPVKCEAPQCHLEIDLLSKVLTLDQQERLNICDTKISQARDAMGGSRGRYA